MALERKPTAVLITAGACMLACDTVAAGEDPVIWEQLPFGYLATTSNTDCGESSHSLADGFVGDGRDIVGLAWWGAIKSNAELLGFEIGFWSLPGDCPGELLDLQTFDKGQFVEYPGGEANRYEATLDVPFTAGAGMPYAVSVTAIACDPDDPFPLHFFWHNGEGNGVPFCSILYSSGEPWEPANSQAELAFVLYAEMPTSPTLPRSWGAIKSTFRRAVGAWTSGKAPHADEGRCSHECL